MTTKTLAQLENDILVLRRASNKARHVEGLVERTDKKGSEKRSKALNSVMMPRFSSISQGKMDVADVNEALAGMEVPKRVSGCMCRHWWWF